MLKLGDIFPNFKAETNEGPIQFHDWLGDSWGLFFSHPADYTPVCTTELARFARFAAEFKKRGVKIIALSCDSVESHRGWIKDISAYGNLGGDPFPYPIIADERRELAMQLGMVDPEEVGKDGLPLTARAVFVIAPDKKLKLSILYPATTGRNLDEILRVIDSLQMTSRWSVATPADWKQGEACMIMPSLSRETAKSRFPDMKVLDVPSGKEYMRTTELPKPSF